MATCETHRFEETTQPPTLLNPTLLVEVTSDSTRSRDTTDKLDAYFRLEGLREYWIVDPDQPYVLRYVRTEGGGLVHFIRGLDQSIASDLLREPLSLRDAYRPIMSQR